jgi:Fe-S cluster assembly scaffold protein SufB
VTAPTEASPTDPSAETATRPRRPPRRAPDELSFSLDRDLVEAFAAAEPDWLAADRRSALARFEALPVESNTLYTPYVDLRAAELEGVRAYEEPAAELDASAPTQGRDDASALAAFNEDRLLALDVDAPARSAGVTIDTIGRLIAGDADAARRLLTHPVSLPTDDKLAQLSRAGWNQGVIVRVPDGVRLSRPIVVRWRVGAPGRALLTRTIVELGEGAEASIVEEIVPSDGHEADRHRPDHSSAADPGQALFTGTTEITLGRGSRLAFASLQEAGDHQVLFQQRTARIGEGATMHWALAQLGGRLVRSRIDDRLEGDRSELELNEIVFATGDQLFDMTTYTRHIGRDTTGSVLSKGALRDRTRMFLKGLATIERSATGTDSFLGEYGMNLSKATRSVAIPSLEIDQPDCRRAAHSSSVGPIDETQVFYLESRGIPDDEARKFIVLGYLEPVVARVPHASAQERLRRLLDRKWAGTAEAARAA